MRSRFSHWKSIVIQGIAWPLAAVFCLGWPLASLPPLAVGSIFAAVPQDETAAAALTVAPWQADDASIHGPSELLLESLRTITDEDLWEHASYLADDMLEGREAGTAGGQQAGDYLLQRVRALGLEPAGPDGEYFQACGPGMRNILARLPGSDPRVAHETVVIGAHYDHLGSRPQPNAGDQRVIYNGANDNASGVAGVLEIAEAFVTVPTAPRRSILFAFWDGEEKNLVGSRYFVENPSVPLDHLVFVIAVDMIGRVEDNRFVFWGTGTAAGLRAMITRHNVLSDLDIEFRAFNLTRSDHQPFFLRRIPVLLASSGVFPELHRPEDEVELLNVEGMRRATQLLHGIVQDLADREENFRFVAESLEEAEHNPGRAADPIKPRLDDESLPLGFSYQRLPREPDALIVVKVAAGTPAALAGLESGDRIHRIDGEDAASRLGSAGPWEAREDLIRMLVERRGRFHVVHVDPASAPLRSPGPFEPTGTMHAWSVVDVHPVPCEGDGVRTFAGHLAAVRSVEFSPDGRLLATGSFDHCAALWNVTTGARVAWLRGHEDLINDLAFSSDSSRLATGSFDGTVRVWNVGSGLQEMELNADVRVYAVAWCPLSTHLLAACADHTVKIWNAAAGHLVETLTGHGDVVECLAFSPDGRHLATAAWDKSIIVWDWRNRREVKRFAGSLEPRSVAFDADGRTFALVGGPSPVIQLWDVESGIITETLEGHQTWINAVAFNRSGSQFASASLDRRFAVWSSGDPIPTHLVEGHSNQVWTVAFSPDGHWLATGSDDGTARLWKVAQLPARGAVPLPPSAPEHGMEIDGSTILARHDGHPVNTLFGGESSGYWGIDTGTGYSQLRLWRVDGDALVPLQLGLPAQGPCSMIRLLRDRRWLVTFSRAANASPSDRTALQLRLCDLSAQREVTRWYQLDTPPAVSPRFFFSERWVGATSADGVRLWDLDSPDFSAHCVFVRYATPPRRTAITPVGISHDGRWLVAGNQLVDLNQWTGQSIELPVSAEEGARLPSWSGDGRWVVSGSRLFDLTRADPAAEPLELTVEADSIASGFSRDGRYLAVRSGSRLQVLDLLRDDPRPTAHQVEALTSSRGGVSYGFSGAAQSLESGFSPDGRWLALGGFDSTCRVVDLESGQVHDLSPGDARSPALTYWSPDSRWLVGSGREGVLLYDLSRLPTVGQPMKLAEAGERASHSFPAFLRSGRWVTCQGRAPLTLLDLTAEDPLAASVTIPDATSTFLAIVDGGRRLVTTPFPRPDRDTDGQDRSQPAWMQLWDLQSDRFPDQPITLGGHQGWISMLRMSPDGQWLMTSGSRYVRLWNIPAVVSRHGTAVIDKN
jgi:WD40 repeat protein